MTIELSLGGGCCGCVLGSSCDVNMNVCSSDSLEAANAEAVIISKVIINILVDFII